MRMIVEILSLRTNRHLMIGYDITEDEIQNLANSYQIDDLFVKWLSVKRKYCLSGNTGCDVTPPGKP